MWLPDVMKSTPDANISSAVWLGEPESAGGVLAVGDHDVDVVLFADEGQMFGERLATGSADHVGDGEDRDVLL